MQTSDVKARKTYVSGALKGIQIVKQGEKNELKLSSDHLKVINTYIHQIKIILGYRFYCHINNYFTLLYSIFCNKKNVCHIIYTIVLRLHCCMQFRYIRKYFKVSKIQFVNALFFYIDKRKMFTLNQKNNCLIQI